MLRSGPGRKGRVGLRKGSGGRRYCQGEGDEPGGGDSQVSMSLIGNEEDSDRDNRVLEMLNYTNFLI